MLYFKMNMIKFDKGSILFADGEQANLMYVVVDGIVEIVTKVDNNVDLVIQRLPRGSIIN